MAYNKEATVIAIDVGSNMKEIVYEGKSALQVSLDCARRLLQNKLFTESKDEFSLIFFGTEDTENRLNEQNQNRFQNMTTVCPISLVDWGILSALSEYKGPSKEKGDIFEALTLAVDAIDQDNKNSKKKRFAQRRIIVLSNLKGYLNASKSQLKDLVNDFRTKEIDSLQIIGCDLETLPPTDHSAKTLQAPKPVELVNFFCDQLVEDGVCALKDSYSFGDAISYTNHFAARQVRPAPWKCILEIGDTINIPMVGFTRIKAAAPKQNWKKAYVQDSSVQVQRSTSYYIQKDLERKEIPREELIDAYRFGTSLIPFTDADKANMKFTKLGKRLQLLCFADKHEVAHNLFVGSDVKVLTALQSDEAAALAVSALVHALIEENKVIVANYGYNAISAPKVVSLSPHICEKGKYEGFYMHYLPFEEDIRSYQFKSLNDPKLPQPTAEQLDVMGDLIDKLTLSSDDENFDKISPRNIRNPYLQKLYQSLEFRAMHDDPLPDVDPGLLHNLEMPKNLAGKASAVKDHLKELFPTKKVEPKHAAKKGVFEENQEQVSGGIQVLDGISSLDISSQKVPVITEIGTITPAEHFTQMVENTTIDRFREVVKMAIEVVHQLIFNTFNGAAYAGKVMQLIAAIREKCLERECIDLFNAFLKEFRDNLFGKRQVTIWDKLCQSKLTLINKQDHEKSGVSAREAREFLEKIPEETKEVKEIPEDENDVFAEMFA